MFLGDARPGPGTGQSRQGRWRQGRLPRRFTGSRGRTVRHGSPGDALLGTAVQAFVAGAEALACGQCVTAGVALGQ